MKTVSVLPVDQITVLLKFYFVDGGEKKEL
jgi:hypothetical protein